MKLTYILVPIQGIFLILSSLLAPLLVLFVIPFIKWDTKETTHPQRTNYPVTTIFGDLPWWLSWFQTPDQRLPGDLAIKEINDIFIKYGKWGTSYNWLGIRNRMMGLAVWLGERTSDYTPSDIEGFWERTDEFGYTWRYIKTFGSIKFVSGHEVYAMLDGSFRTAPIFTIKRK